MSLEFVLALALLLLGVILGVFWIVLEIKDAGRWARVAGAVFAALLTVGGPVLLVMQAERIKLTAFPGKSEIVALAILLNQKLGGPIEVDFSRKVTGVPEQGRSRTVLIDVDASDPVPSASELEADLSKALGIADLRTEIRDLVRILKIESDPFVAFVAVTNENANFSVRSPMTFEAKLVDGLTLRAVDTTLECRCDAGLTDTVHAQCDNSIAPSGSAYFRLEFSNTVNDALRGILERRLVESVELESKDVAPGAKSLKVGLAVPARPSLSQSGKVQLVFDTFTLADLARVSALPVGRDAFATVRFVAASAYTQVGIDEPREQRLVPRHRCLAT